MPTVTKLGLFPSSNSCPQDGIAPPMIQFDFEGTTPLTTSPCIVQGMTAEQAVSFIWRVKSWRLSWTLEWRWLYTIYEYNEEEDQYNRTAREYLIGTDSRESDIYSSLGNEKTIVCTRGEWRNFEEEDGRSIFIPVDAFYLNDGEYSIDAQFGVGTPLFEDYKILIGNSAGSEQDLPSGAIPFLQRVNLKIKWLSHEFDGLIGIEGSPENSNDFPAGAQTRDGDAIVSDPFNDTTPTFLEITSSDFTLEAVEYWPYDPNDGLGPIYDSSTGEQLRPFP
jgi:hypothetical protein